MTDTLSENEIISRIQSTVARRNQYEQGDLIYGVQTFHSHPESHAWSSMGKLFTSKQRATEYFNEDTTLIGESMNQDNVFYKGIVDVVDANSEDVFVTAPDEEIELTLMEIVILDRKEN